MPTHQGQPGPSQERLEDVGSTSVVLEWQQAAACLGFGTQGWMLKNKCIKYKNSPRSYREIPTEDAPTQEAKVHPPPSPSHSRVMPPSITPCTARLHSPTPFGNGLHRAGRCYSGSFTSLWNHFQQQRHRNVTVKPRAPSPATARPICRCNHKQTGWRGSLQSLVCF